MTRSVSKLLFIVGAPRSGTHMLRFMLTAGNEVSIAPETFCTYRFYGSRVVRRLFPWGAYKREMIAQLTAPNADTTMTDFDNAEADLNAALQSKQSIQIMRECLSCYTDTSAKFIGDKSPINSFFVRWAKKNAPETKVIEIRRSALDQLSSFEAADHIGEGVLRGLAYRRLVQSRLKNVERYTVLFEDLVEDTEAALSKICAYLEVEYKEAMLNPVMFKSSFATDSEPKKIGVQKEAIGRSHKRLSEDQINFITLVETSLSQAMIKYPKRTLQVLSHWLRLRRIILQADLGLVSFGKVFRRWLSKT